MVLITLRASEEVRAAAFEKPDTDIDADIVAVAETIIMRRSDRLDPTTFRDRYQETLREVIEAKMKGLPVQPKQIAPPAPVHDFMAALKRGLTQEAVATAKPKHKTAALERKEEGHGSARNRNGPAAAPPQSVTRCGGAQ